MNHQTRIEVLCDYSMLMYARRLHACNNYELFNRNNVNIRDWSAKVFTFYSFHLQDMDASTLSEADKSET